MSIVQTYVKEIVSRMKTGDREKAELELELTDHLTLLKNDYVSKGYAEQDLTDPRVGLSTIIELSHKARGK